MRRWLEVSSGAIVIHVTERTVLGAALFEELIQGTYVRGAWSGEKLVGKQKPLGIQSTSRQDRDLGAIGDGGV